MKANELRIGNWVTGEDGKIIQIKAIEDKYIWYANSLYTELKSIESIILTPIILSKSLTKVNDKEFKIEIPVSWSKTHHTEYFFYVKLYEYYATGEAHVGWRPWIKRGKDAEIEEIFLWGYLESVHQLQNFYYSVCQSEIQIKF